ncbi:MAG: hypothetical protein M9890_02620 [Thermomicrobiales bacterium]|nr:hypothetical protein [Thermomicrobiales bacterium]
MTYQATRDVVRRVMPLLDKLATETIDKARLLQYLSASAAVDWKLLDIVADRVNGGERSITYRDRKSGEAHTLVYPAVLSESMRDLVLAEYKRLAVSKPLTSMDVQLFDQLFGRSHCDLCAYRGEQFDQFHRECHFAGHPVNFTPEP